MSSFLGWYKYIPVHYLISDGRPIPFTAASTTTGGAKG